MKLFSSYRFLMFISVLCMLVTIAVWSAITQKNPLDRKLVRAIFNGKSKEVVSLLKMGANPNSRDEEALLDETRQSALIVAIDWRMRETTGHIKKRGYTPGNAPPENTVIVRALLEKGANVQSRNQVGCTPLMIAAWQGKNATLKLLLNYDQKINTQKDTGYTAIMLAVAGHNIESIKILLEHGADFESIRDDDGDTCLSLAQVRKDADIVKLLLNFKLKSDKN